MIGYSAGYGVTGNSYSNNVVIGSYAGEAITTGSNNIIIGYDSGDVITSGANNIIIGYQIDPTGAVVSNELNIGALIYGDLANNRAGINVTPPNLAAALHVDQPASDGAEPALLLDQADIDYVMVKFVGTAEAASADRTFVADSDFGTPGALVGWIQVEIEDIGNRITDGDYYIPIYAAPS
jgi:hypothetical protein